MMCVCRGIESAVECCAVLLCFRGLAGSGAHEVQEAGGERGGAVRVEVCSSGCFLHGHVKEA